MKKKLTAGQFLEAAGPPASEVLLLEASDDFLEEQVLNRLRADLLEPGFEDFNYQMIRCSRTTGAGVLLDALAELPVMTERRLLVLREVDSLAESTSQALALGLGEGRAQGLVAVLTFAPSRKKSKPPALDAAAKLGPVISCSMPAEEALHWAREQLNALGISSAGGALEELMARVGENLRSVRSHLERLAMLVGKGGKITKKQVQELVPFSSTVQMWKLTAAIGGRKLGEAVTILDAQLDRGENPGSILGYLNSYLVSLVQTGGLFKRLGSAAAVAKAMPTKKEFQIKKTLQELKTWGARDLEQAFEMMARADQRLKTGSEARLVLQLLLFQLCNRRPAKA